MTDEFSTPSLNVTFDQQENPERVALGEQFKRVVYAPKNANGNFKNMLTNQFDWQVRASAQNAGIQACFGLPDNELLHLYDEFHPERLGGFVGWIHANLLGTEPRVLVEGMNVINTFTRNQTTSFREYGSIWEWARLFQVSQNTYQARQDNSYGKLANGERTTFPWGYLKHVHLADLISGTTLITYPLIRKWAAPDGTETLDTKAQDKAKWLYATLSSIKNGEITLEDSRRQFYTNQLFFRISAQEYQRMEASGQVDATLQAQVTADAVTVNNGGKPAPRETKVKVNGRSIPVNLIPQGRYIATMPNKTAHVETLSLIGRRRLEQLAQTHNGNLSLKTFVPES